MGKKVTTILAVILAVVTVALAAVGVLYAQEKQTVGKYVQQQAELSALIESLNADVAEKESEIDTLNADVADKASQIDTLNTDVAEKNEEIEALNADVADKASQIDALNADVADKATQIDALNADVADKASQIDALNADVADKASQIDALNADVADKNSQIDTLNADVADKASQIDALNADVSAKKSEIDALNADSTGKDNTIENLNAELERLRQSGSDKVEIPSHIPGVYSTTREFLYVLDQEDIIYSYKGIDSDGDERVTLDYSIADRDFTLQLWFSSDCDDVALRVWDVITFTDSEKATVQSLCDTLNGKYRFTNFCTEYDNTVSLMADFILPVSGSGEVVRDGVFLAVLVLDDLFTSMDSLTA